MNTVAKKPFVITPVYDLLLRDSQDMPIGLYHVHLATAEQLTRLHYKPGMLKTVKKRLKDSRTTVLFKLIASLRNALRVPTTTRWIVAVCAT